MISEVIKHEIEKNRMKSIYFSFVFMRLYDFGTVLIEIMQRWQKLVHRSPKLAQQKQELVHESSKMAQQSQELVQWKCKLNS